MVANAIIQQAGRYWFPWARDATSASQRSRQDLYRDLDGYYYNSLWSEQTRYLLRSLTSWAAGGEVQGLYNPVKTIVDFYRLYTLQGRLGADGDARAEARIVTANPAIVPALLDIIGWSGLDTVTRSLIPRLAANLGDCLLVAVDDARPDDPAAAKVWIEVRHPAELVDWDFDSRGNLTLARLRETRYERDEAGRKRAYLYERQFTKTEYATFRDGRPASFRPDGLTRWPNPHGFVPVRLVKHQDDGDDFGLNAWHDAIPAINEINLRATHIGDIIGQHFAAVWAFFGAGPPAISNAQGAEEEQELDRGKALYLPGQADAKPLVAGLDFANAYTHIDRLLAWLRERFPELTLPELRRRTGELSGVAVRGMLLDLINRAEAAQANYTAELVRALQMALTMGRNIGGAGRDLWQERGYGDLGRYEDGAFAFDIVWRPIIPLSEEEQLRLAAERAALEDELAQRQALRRAAAGSGDVEAALAGERQRAAGGA